jgi:anti-anti-sigma regulatory factor
MEGGAGDADGVHFMDGLGLVCLVFGWRDASEMGLKIRIAASFSCIYVQ